jgi:hypothetical protein
MTSEEKEREETKRERRWDPLLRWKVFQETIAFVDSQQPVPRNSRASCLARQARLWQSSGLIKRELN